MSQNHFFEMIKTLRENEAVVLYHNVLKIKSHDRNATLDFLKNAYAAEQVNYPFLSPGFNEEAAIWAAEVVYLSAQLILYRKDKPIDLQKLIPAETLACNSSTILSADLCLRFLPDMITELKIIDPEDKLIEILEGILKKWHYSGVNFEQDLTELDLEPVLANQCLKQLYADRIVLYKQKKWAAIPLFNKMIEGNLGIHAPELWSDFKPIMENE